MKMNLKELAKTKERLAPGHRLCPGCAAPIIVRQTLKAIKDDVVVATATGCLEVSTTIYPYTSWRVPWIHNAFENAAATISGVETMYRALKKRGMIKKEIKFVAFGGDGGTYDIGLQSLSGALERGHDFLYICYDNEAYMNTGIQRSSATPRGAWTNTCQVGKVLQGKQEYKKDLTSVVAAHHIPYVATATPANYVDLMQKVQKAISTPGPAFMNILSPCPRGWRFDPRLTIKICQLAVDTCFWPLFEIENGKYKLSYNPGGKKKPISDWIKSQGRYKHIWHNSELIEEIQKHVDEAWAKLMIMVDNSSKNP